MLVRPYNSSRRISLPPAPGRSKTPQPARRRQPSLTPRSRTPDPSRRRASGRVYLDLDDEDDYYNEFKGSTQEKAPLKKSANLEKIHQQVRVCLNGGCETSSPSHTTPDRTKTFDMTEIPHLSDAQISEFKEAFAMFDKNGDGSISRAELGTVMKSLGQHPTDGELADMIKEADGNENGCVDFNEFLVLMSKKMSMLDIDQELLEAFSVFDKDGNGYIDKDELTNVLSSLEEELDENQVKDMMKQADKNGDGLVSFDEFKAVMCSKS